ncbi:hypothetical protein E4V18_09990, partial [Proteus mirabilis]
LYCYYIIFYSFYNIIFYYNVNEFYNLLIILIGHNTIRNIMVTYKKKPIDNKVEQKSRNKY